MKFGIAAVAALALIGAPQIASAHHSFAAFDNSKTITVSGTIREFQWTNPHSWIQIIVNSPTGASRNTAPSCPPTSPVTVAAHGSCQRLVSV